MIIRPVKWITLPGEDGTGLLQAWAGEGAAEFPLPIETRGVRPEDVKMGKEQDFDLLLMCADELQVYEDEEDFRDAERSMAPESVIPAGLIPAPGEGKFVPSPRIILNGKVERICPDAMQFGLDAGDVLFTVSCLGNGYDVLLPMEYTLDVDSVPVSEGSIVSGVFWVLGRIGEEE